MENFFGRYKNPLVLMAVLFIQVIALATQVKRPDVGVGGSAGTRVIRLWTVSAVTPLERVLVGGGQAVRNVWLNYVDLRDVRKQNHNLQAEVDHLRMEQVRLQAAADSSQRLRALLDFKERYVGQSVAADVIGTSGSDTLRTVTIDKGSRAGVKQDMAVITPDGVVGKVKEVSPWSAQVLLINDRESGAGVILERSRLHGILRGAGQGELAIGDVMADEQVDVGEPVVTSGGDRVYPKGLPVGVVTHVGNDPDGGPFLAVKVKPAADLNRLEEVLVVTKIAEEEPAAVAGPGQPRAAEILAERLPGISKTPSTSTPGKSPGAASLTGQGRPAMPVSPPKATGLASSPKPGTSGAQKEGQLAPAVNATPKPTGASATHRLPAPATQKANELGPAVNTDPSEANPSPDSASGAARSRGPAEAPGQTAPNRKPNVKAKDSDSPGSPEKKPKPATPQPSPTAPENPQQ